MKPSVKLIADLMINKNLDKEFPEPAGLVAKLYALSHREYAENNTTENAVKQVLSENPEVVISYKNGKGQIIGFLIGQVQKLLKGKGDPKLINSKLVEKLREENF